MDIFCFWPPVLYPTYLCLFDTIKTAESRGLSCSTGKGGLYDNVVETRGGDGHFTDQVLQRATMRWRLKVADIIL